MTVIAPATPTPARTARYADLYITRVARDSHGRHRHLFRGSGSGGISSVCQDALFTVALVDDQLGLVCTPCRLVALTELSLAVDGLGLHDLAIRIAAHARDTEYATWAPGELSEQFGR